MNMDTVHAMTWNGSKWLVGARDATLSELVNEGTEVLVEMACGRKATDGASALYDPIGDRTPATVWPHTEEMRRLGRASA